MKIIKSILFYAAALLVSFLTIVLLMISYSGYEKSQKANYEKMMASQNTDSLRDGRTFVVTAIKSITGTDLNLITVTLAEGGHQEYITEQSGIFMNAICPKNRNFAIGEPVKLLYVNYQHNLGMGKDFCTIK